MAVPTLISLMLWSKHMARVFRGMTKKLNDSHPLRTPDGVAFPLPSNFPRAQGRQMHAPDGKNDFDSIAFSRKLPAATPRSPSRNPLI
jgi:hypothetical protein